MGSNDGGMVSPTYGLVNDNGIVAAQPVMLEGGLDVRYTPNSRHGSDRVKRPLCANSRHQFKQAPRSCH
jgi:hypothetical protein